MSLEDDIRAAAGSIGTLSIIRTEKGFQGNFQARGDKHQGWRVHVAADPVDALLGALRTPVMPKPAPPATAATEEDMFG